MTILSTDQLKTLVESSSGSCVSIYMSVQKAGPDIMDFQEIKYTAIKNDNHYIWGGQGLPTATLDLPKYTGKIYTFLA